MTAPIYMQPNSVKLNGATHPCPRCGKLNGATISHGDAVKDGDASLCASCGALSRLQSGKLVPMTTVDVMKMSDQERETIALAGLEIGVNTQGLFPMKMGTKPA